MDKDNINKKHISARVPEQVHHTLAVAAKKSGLSLNQFLMQAALEKALLVINNQNANAVDNPPVVNEKLAEGVVHDEDSALNVSQRTSEER
jgi:uncharacterized protein (DUF1778 family)